MARIKILSALVTLALGGCDYPDTGYETSKHHAERMACEQDNRANAKAAKDLAYAGRDQEADIFDRTHPTHSCPEKP
jgi:hypothetical protein